MASLPTILTRPFSSSTKPFTRLRRVGLFYLTSFIVLLASCLSGKAQGIDSVLEGKMQNETGSNSRDQKAVQEAVQGWWTRSMKNHDTRIAWWREARFGMFIHWGVYSRAAGEWEGKKVGGYAEHIMRIKKIPRATYLKLAHEFNPTGFDADAWVLQAKKAGMRYMIITAKHHDGFAMYDSKVSDYNIVKQTPFHKDPMAALSAACKKYGIKFGFYYSHAFDWEDPNAPGNDWDYHNPGGDSKIGGERWYDNHPDWLPRIQKYVEGKAIPQIKELIAKYHPDILWFDTPHKLPLSENIHILKALREADTSADIVVNGRLARSAAGNFGDYQNTADRPAEFYPVAGDWEAIPTTNESYGYSKFDLSQKPASHFIRLLASAASRGGNLLMNIGPMGDGRFDPKDISILNGIGSWMDKNSASIYGTQRSPIPLQSWGVATTKGNKLYLHVFQWPADGHLYLGGVNATVQKANLLTAPGQPLPFKKINGQDLILTLPRQAPDTVNTVIELTMAAPAENKNSDAVRYVATNTALSRLLAYDAQQINTGTGRKGGFGFGDGKKDRYFVDGWTSKDQALEWTFRTGFDSDFQIALKYVADKICGGRYKLQIDEEHFSRPVKIDPSVKSITEKMDMVHLRAGIHHLKITAEQISGKELMKVLEVQLQPKPRGQSFHP